MSVPRAPASVPGVLLQCLSALLILSLLAQFFIAGMSAMTNPEWWSYHRSWVAIFQWLVVPMPFVAWFAGSPRKLRMILATLPLIQIAMQYVLVHRALDGRLPSGVGLHALNGALVLIVAVLLTAGYGESRH